MIIMFIIIIIISSVVIAYCLIIVLFFFFFLGGGGGRGVAECKVFERPSKRSLGCTLNPETLNRSVWAFGTALGLL